MMSLRADHFSEFFAAVHGHPPFPWQIRLASQVVESGEWPPLLDLPTGSGKTAAIDIAVFHLAIEAEQRERRRAAVRIAFVVDRRLVVDDARRRAERIANALATAIPGSLLASVASRLRVLSGDGPPLLARSLRGGMPLEDDWVRSPSQPVVLCSTVDQIGSRLLFRGYGVSDRMKPVHAGLVGSDCLILLDEAHLAEPFRQTLSRVTMYRGDAWRDTTRSHPAPFGVATLTATPGTQPIRPFGLNGEDYENDVLRRRLRAAKPARLIRTASPRSSVVDTRPADEDDPSGLDAFVSEVGAALAAFAEYGSGHPAIAVVVNRVGRARALFERLRAALPELRDDVTLMVGPVRPVDRDRLVRALEAVRTTPTADRPRRLDHPLILVATQCIEAGVDIDLDALITEAAPLDALRQRFGRLNRAGRDIQPYAAVVGLTSVVGSRTSDPVYGESIRAAWKYLTSHARSAGRNHAPTLDFGIDTFNALVAGDPPPEGAYSPKPAAPVLMPAHLDLLCQTSPVPLTDPDVALYLHGSDREPDAVSVVWRADVFPLTGSDWNEDNERLRRLLLLMPPRSTEAIQLPVWAVRRWLNGQGRTASAALADVPSRAAEGDPAARPNNARRVFRWRGDDERSRWILPSEIRPGDTIVVPTRYGGLDEFGWNPSQRGELDGGPAVADRGDVAALPYAGRRFVVRVVPGLIGEDVALETLLETLANSPDDWQARRDALLQLPLPTNLRGRLLALDHARGGRRQVTVHDDLYGDDAGRPRGVVFVARLGLREADRVLGELVSDGSVQDERIGLERPQTPTTEDDVLGSTPGFPVPLDVHTANVADKAEELALRAGLPASRVADVKVAAVLHDIGKVDERFQAWLHSSDPLGAPAVDEPRHFLAKSGRRLSWQARDRLGLPERWRHEALSVRIASASDELARAGDPDLVLWLIGTHHGYGRPFFPHDDCEDQRARMLPVFDRIAIPRRLEPGAGPQSLAFDWRGLDWVALGQRLAARYGIWELARMEAILRLADHRASEEEAERVPTEEVRG